MKIQKIELFEVKVPFRFSFRHALHSRSVSHCILVCVTTDAGSLGWGEAHPRPYLTGESIDSCLRFAREEARNLLRSLNFSSAIAPWDTLSDSFISADQTRNLAIWSAIDVAIVDAWSRTFQVPVEKILNRTSTLSTATNEITAPVGLASLPAQLALAVGFGLSGFKHFKVKADSRINPENLTFLRKILGPKRDLRIDANGSWDLETTKKLLPELEKSGISLLEQPVAADKAEDLAELARVSPIPVMADESYCSLSDARMLVELKASRFWNFRLGKNGGFTGWKHHRSLAEANGIEIQIGSLVGELGPLQAASAIVRPSSGCRYFESGFPQILLRDLVFGDSKADDFWCPGKIPLEHLARNAGSDAPGVAAAPDQTVLKKFLLRVHSETI